MNTPKVIEELQKRYPGKNIMSLPPDNPSEIICEVEPTNEHADYSNAVAVIDHSAAHFHKKSTEIYTVTRGEVTLFLNGKKNVLKQGEKCIIAPWTIHWVEADEAWVETYSTPGWTPADHILLRKEEEIHLVPYDPSWPTKFESEKTLIEKTLGSWIVGGVHHVGSTAVPGLSAKPVIDIMVGVKNLEEAKPCIELLEKIHYMYFPYRPEIMHWFCKPSMEHRTHHLHMMEEGSRAWKERLAFRDYLRLHADVRDAYQKLKISLAEKFRDDRESYTDSKTEFVRTIVARATKK